MSLVAPELVSKKRAAEEKKRLGLDQIELIFEESKAE